MKQISLDDVLLSQDTVEEWNRLCQEFAFRLQASGLTVDAIPDEQAAVLDDGGLKIFVSVPGEPEMSLIVPADKWNPRITPTGLRPLDHLRYYTARYPNAWKWMDSFRADRGKHTNWAGWCYLPVAGAYAIVSRGQSPIDPARLPDVAALAALGAWRMTKGVYRFDPTVLEALWDTPLEGELPIDVLFRLPEWCVYIETPGRVVESTMPLHGFYAHLESDANTGSEELRLLLDTDAGLVSLPVHLVPHNTLSACVELALIESRRQAQISGQDYPYELPEMASAYAKIIAPLVSVVLYLCSVSSEIADAKGSDRQPRNPGSIKTRHGKKMIAASGPTTWQVAYRLGAAIRAAEQRERFTAQGGTHASPRAHVRRAHWHSYWTGPRESENRKSVVKWLPPIPVNVPDVKSLPAVIKKVKS